jgi:beta-glucanase (GH16 family)
MKNILLIALIFYGCSSSKHLNNPNRVLSWQDDFNGQESFNESSWTKIPRGSSDWNRHMSDYDSLYEVRNGNLVLRGIKNNSQANDTSRFLTGGLYTKGKVGFGFGRLEIRAKLNGAKGAWPAFWMLPETGRWPSGGEIDIMERLSFDSIAYQTVHSSYTQLLKIKDNPRASSTAPIRPYDFNTYALERYPDSLVFFINGKRNFAYPRIKTDKEGQFPFDSTKFYLLVDMQLGGSWVGPVDTKHLPVEMEIDWVKFYEFKFH